MKINRRRFLQGLGLAGVALPYLPSIMGPERALAAVGHATSTLIVTAHNGVRKEDFYVDPGTLSTRLPSASDRALYSLRAHASRVSVLRGVQMSEGPINGGHGTSYAQMLSGSSTIAPGGNPDWESWSTGESVDFFVARRRRSGGQPLLIQSALNGIGPTQPSFRLDATGSAEPVTAFRSPSLTLESLRPSIVGEADPTVMRRSDIRSVLRAQTQRLLSSPALGSEDRARLQTHVEAFADAEIHITSCTPDGVPSLLPDGVDGESHDANMQSYARLVAWAFSCGLVDTCTLQIGDAGDRTLYDGEVHHDHAHASDDIMHAIDTKIQSYFAGFLDALASYPSSNGGADLLDDSLAVWTNGIANNLHDFYDTPWIFAGGAGGALRTDQMVDLFAVHGDYVNHARVLATLAHLSGVTNEDGSEITTFGRIGGAANTGLVTELLA